MKLKSFKNIFALLLLSVLASCGKPKLPDNAYSVPMVIVNPMKTPPHHVPTYFHGYKEQRIMADVSEERRMYSYFKDHHYFANDNLEIEYSQLYFNNNPGKRMYLIGAKYAKKPDSLSAYFLRWSNAPVPMTVDMYPRTYHFKWEIGKYTDSLETNLSLKEINRLYPKFKGAYVQKFPKKIIIDHNEAYDHFKSKEPVIFEY